MPLVWVSDTLLAVVTVCDWVAYEFPRLRYTLVSQWRHNQKEHDEKWGELMWDYYSSNRNDRLSCQFLEVPSSDPHPPPRRRNMLL